MLNRLNLYFGLFFFFLSLLFYFNPTLDIEVARVFYNEEEGFFFAHNPIVLFIFRAVPIITMIYGISLLIWTIILFRRKDNTHKVILNIAILVSLILGSGILVNMGLKDNFGRARPKQIREFGAKKEFSKVYEMANQCHKNCSFASGHAAAAYAITTVAFLVPPNLQTVTFVSGILYGTLVGIGRIIQGGHFVSDVASSAWIVLIVNYLVISLCMHISRYDNSQD